MPETATAPSPTLETVASGLHATAAQPLSFAPEVGVRAFLLMRPRGNLLVYANGAVSAAIPAIAALGGVARHYLNHWHEAWAAGKGPSETLDAPLYCHAAEQEEVAKYLEVAATFDGPHRLDGDFEVIPIPGHTEGATAYLWAHSGNRFLFTGDLVYLSHGDWRGALLEQRPRRLHRQPRAARRPRLRPSRPLGRIARRPGPGPDRPGRRRRTPRPDHRALAEQGRLLDPPSRGRPTGRPPLRAATALTPVEIW